MEPQVGQFVTAKINAYGYFPQDDIICTTILYIEDMNETSIFCSILNYPKNIYVCPRGRYSFALVPDQVLAQTVSDEVYIKLQAEREETQRLHTVYQEMAAEMAEFIGSLEL